MNIIALVGSFLYIRFVMLSWPGNFLLGSLLIIALTSPGVTNLIGFCTEKFGDLRNFSILKSLALRAYWFGGEVFKRFSEKILHFSASNMMRRVGVRREGMQFVSLFSYLFVTILTLESFWWIFDKNLLYESTRNCCKAVCTSLVSLFNIFFDYVISLVLPSASGIVFLLD